MEHSESIKEIAKALGQFQYSVGSISKDAVNPFYKSKYASLENIVTAITDKLATNKLTFSQLPDGDGLTTILMHESGEWIKATMKLNMGTKPQEQGSAITYARRYALSAVLGLVTDEDDDANAASAKKEPGVFSGFSITGSPVPQKALQTPFRATKEQAVAAVKERILAQLKILGLAHGTKEECEASVLQNTGLPLIDSKLEEIAEKLAVIIEEVKQNK